MSRIETFEKIAEDIGVLRYDGEGEMSFCARSAYSASRFWAEAFCMDDGSGGRSGITRQALSRRLRAWIGSLDSIMPGLAEWFRTEDKIDARAVYGRLVDLGDILPTGADGRCVARSLKLESIADGASLALGFFEPAAAPFARDMVTSGLASYVPRASDARDARRPWWETDLKFMSWADDKDYGTLQYISPSSAHWSVSNPDLWTREDPGELSLTIARYLDKVTGRPSYLAARSSRGRVSVARVDRAMAQELLLHLKAEVGNPVHVKFERVDAGHCRVYLPVSILPPDISATVDALAWPVGGVFSDRERIFRTEVVRTVTKLLELHEIKVSRP
jgi:hypothetical protein